MEGKLYLGGFLFLGFLTGVCLPMDREPTVSPRQPVAATNQRQVAIQAGDMTELKSSLLNEVAERRRLAQTVLEEIEARKRLEITVNNLEISLRNVTEERRKDHETLMNEISERMRLARLYHSETDKGAKLERTVERLQQSLSTEKGYRINLGVTVNTIRNRVQSEASNARKLNKSVSNLEASLLEESRKRTLLSIIISAEKTAREKLELSHRTVESTLQAEIKARTAIDRGFLDLIANLNTRLTLLGTLVENHGKVLLGTPIRLVKGPSSKEGMVEVRHEGKWGTICDDFFDERSAKVVCRMLGFTGSAIPKTNAFFGRGNATIWLDNVRCAGNETDISNCPHNAWGVSDCSHAEDVGVTCLS